MKRLIIVGAIGLSALAAACGGNNTSDANRNAADYAWSQASPTDRVAICSALSDGIQESEVQAFNEGAQGAFTRDAIVEIMNYVDDQYC